MRSSNPKQARITESIRRGGSAGGSPLCTTGACGSGRVIFSVKLIDMA